MTVSGIGIQGNTLQAIRAQNAFKYNTKIHQEPQKIEHQPDQDVKVSISSKSLDNSEKTLLQKVKDPKVSEITDFATKYNIEDIDEEEIEEALKYGTSLFADYTA